MNLLLLVLVNNYFAVQVPDITPWDLTSLENTTSSFITADGLVDFGFRTSPADTCWENNDCVAFQKTETACVCFGLVSSEQFNIIPGHNGLVFRYSLYVTPENVHYTSDLLLICNNETIINGTQGKTFITINYYSLAGCPKTPPFDYTPPEPKHVLQSWSFGTMFCLLFLIVVVSYFFIGVPINFFVFSSRNADLIPFGWFWKKAFLYVVTGFQTIVHAFCRNSTAVSGVSNSSGSYQVIG